MTPPEDTDLDSIQPSNPSSTESVAGAPSASVAVAPVENIIVGSGPEESTSSSSSAAKKSPNTKARIECLREKYRLLTIRNTILQQENEDFLNKLTDARITLRRGRKYRMMLIQKLDSIGDNWRAGKIKDITTGISNTNTNTNCSTSTANTSNNIDPPSIGQLFPRLNSALSLPHTSTSSTNSLHNSNTNFTGNDNFNRPISISTSTTSNSVTVPVYPESASTISSSSSSNSLNSITTTARSESIVKVKKEIT